MVVGAILWILVAKQLAHRIHFSMPLDFQVYRDAAKSLVHGGDTYDQRFTFAHLSFTYPPAALIVFGALTFAPVATGVSLWWILTSLALMAVVYLAVRTSTDLSPTSSMALALVLSGASALLLEPVRSNFDFGQINVFLMLLVALDTFVVGGRSRGVLVGVATAIKLTPLIYVMYYVLERKRSSVIRSVGTMVVITTIAWLALPRDSLLYWLHQAFSPGHKGDASVPANQSWYGLIDHFSGSLGVWTLPLWVGADFVTFAVGCYLVGRYLGQNRRVEAVVTLALCELLMSPISWTHHWSWIVLLPVVIVARWGRDWWVSSAMLAVLIVAVVAPYHSHPYRWYLHGVREQIMGSSLLLSGAVLLGTLAIVEMLRHRRDHTLVRDAHPLLTPSSDIGEVRHELNAFLLTDPESGVSEDAQTLVRSLIPLSKRAGGAARSRRRERTVRATP